MQEELILSKKKLGFGLMRLPLTNPNDAGSIDIDTMSRMVDTFIERGFTYFDTAWMYCAFKSEDATKKALVERHPRDSYTLATKLHAGFLHSKEDRDKIFQTQLDKTGAGYFDYYLLHDVGVDHYKVYQQLDCFEWIMEKKRQGLVKHVGFSFHDNDDFAPLRWLQQGPLLKSAINFPSFACCIVWRSSLFPLGDSDIGHNKNQYFELSLCTQRKLCTWPEKQEFCLSVLLREDQIV